MADAKHVMLPVGWTPASVLVNATGDAMDNIYDILIEWPWAGGSSNGGVISGAEAAASYRASGFNIPEPKTKTYSVSWRGVSVEKVAAGVELSRKFELTFRLDANYALYQKFVAWRKVTNDINTSGVSNTESALGKIQVFAPGAEYNSMSWTPAKEAVAEKNMLSHSLKNVTNIVWTFEDVQCVNVGQPQFKNGTTGAAMNYKVEFIFGDANYPFYSDYYAGTSITHAHKQG